MEERNSQKKEVNKNRLQRLLVKLQVPVQELKGERRKKERERRKKEREREKRRREKERERKRKEPRVAAIA